MKETSLALACFRLRISYDRGRRMLLTGILSGRPHNGHWMVEEASIDRLVAERAIEQSEPLAATVSAK